MSIITLTTDLGLRDYYVSSIKGAILTKTPEVNVIDISHHITPFSITEAAFILSNAFFEFPKGTIHIIGVDAENPPHLVVSYKEHVFIGADNGIFSLLCTSATDAVRKLNLTPRKSSFATKEILVEAACFLAKGGNVEEISTTISGYQEFLIFKPAFEDNVIRGKVIYIDRYDNVICNITKDLFDKVGKGRRFTIFFRNSKYNINKISQTYNDVEPSEKLALFSQTGYLEIAINKGLPQGAAGLLGLKYDDTIRIEFYDNQNS